MNLSLDLSSASMKLLLSAYISGVVNSFDLISVIEIVGDVNQERSDMFTTVLKQSSEISSIPVELFWF